MRGVIVMVLGQTVRVRVISEGVLDLHLLSCHPQVRNIVGISVW